MNNSAIVGSQMVNFTQVAVYLSFQLLLPSFVPFTSMAVMLEIEGGTETEAEKER